MRRLTLYFLTLMSLPLLAEDRLDLQGTAIIGNQELPKVLYIVPWKKPLCLTWVHHPAILISDALSPLERDEFRRQVRYYYQLSDEQKQDSENQ